MHMKADSKTLLLQVVFEIIRNTTVFRVTNTIIGFSILIFA